MVQVRSESIPPTTTDRTIASIVCFVYEPIFGL